MDHLHLLPAGAGLGPVWELTSELRLKFDVHIGWNDGGALRIYVDDARGDARGEGVDVAPTGDRLVCFFADRVVHEVLPANADRWALTLWFVGNDAECAANRAGAELRAAHFPPG